MKQIYFFFITELNKKIKIAKGNRGFTLIELLVAMVIATLVITPLLGFMINILETDSREQAKSASEQEVQTAIDYIAQDLQQAIYIYDARGVRAIQLQLPTIANALPVLVFWKRELLPDDKKIPVPGLTVSTVNRDDGFVYSLVAYYLVNNSNNSGNIWSNQQSIRRFSVNGGVKDPANPNQYITSLAPEAGFKMFNLELNGTLEDKMNGWERNGNYASSNTAVTLVDFIDKSVPQTTNTAYAPINPINCTTIFTDKTTIDKQDALTVPAFSGTHAYAVATATNPNTSSFYACVDVDRQIAQVFIRGNALARIRNTNIEFNPTGESKQTDSSYFPKANVKVKARGIIGAE